MIAACWIALLTLTVAGYARGTCMRYEKEGGSNTGNGVETPVTKCTYSDQNGKTIEINVNATYRHLTDCTDCKCLTSGVVECCAFGAKAGKMDVPSACTLVKVNNCESKLVLKSDERTPCKAEPVYPSSTESLDSQQNSGTKENENAGNSLTSHGAMFVLTVLCLLLCRLT
ncbi:uncharacterized protein [Magallana gigas]|uniref:uncharacterized protein n=1 Tax=Magallana gigas TaxID=29159 RepID=UPI0033407B60